MNKEVKVIMSATHDKLASDMAKARQAVDTNVKGMAAAVGGFKSSFDGAMKSLLGMRGALMVAAGAAGMAMFIKSAIDTADNMGKMAQSIGMPVESFLHLRMRRNYLPWKSTH
jgi:hypothetical protein